MGVLCPIAAQGYDLGARLKLVRLRNLARFWDPGVCCGRYRRLTWGLCVYPMRKPTVRPATSASMNAIGTFQLLLYAAVEAFSPLRISFRSWSSSFSMLLRSCFKSLA